MKIKFYLLSVAVLYNVLAHTQFTQTVNSTYTIGELDNTISVPKFNSHIGLLTGVAITVTVTNAGKNNMFGAENTVAGGATATCRKYLDFELYIENTTSGTMYESVTNNLVNTFNRTFPGYDGTTDFTGASGFNQLDNAINYVYNYAGDVASFNSNDGSPIEIINSSSYSLNSTQIIGGGGNLSTQYLTTYDFIVSVSYTYETVLPVNIIEVSANSNTNNSVLLTWKTSEEDNIEYYNVEFSKDGQHYETVGKVQAKSTQGENIYSFIHQLGYRNDKTALYRLKYVEKNGKTGYSIVSKVKLKNTNASGYSLYPNPVMKSKGQLTIIGKNPIGVYSIYAFDGKLFFSKYIASNGSAVAIDIHTLDAGKYFVRTPEGKAISFVVM